MRLIETVSVRLDAISYLALWKQQWKGEKFSETVRRVLHVGLDHLHNNPPPRSPK